MMADNLQTDCLKQSGQVENYKTRRKHETNKETKKIANGFTKSYYEEKEENKKKEIIMPYHYGHGMKKKKKKKKKGKKKR